MRDNSDLFGRVRSEVARAFARVVSTVVAPDMGLDLPIERLVSQYLAELRVRATTPSTIKSFEQSLARLVRDLHLVRVRDINRVKIVEWRQMRVAEGVANRTANADVAPLKAALAFALYLGQIKAHPLAGLRSLPITGKNLRRRARPLSDAELLRLLKAASELDLERGGGTSRAVLVLALASTGARWGELTAATWLDLDVAACSISLRAETTKTAVARELPLDPGLLAALLSVRQEYARKRGTWPAPGSRIFLTRRGKPWPKNTANFLRFLNECYRRAGIEKVDAAGRHAHTHCMRTSFASRLARFGVPVAIAQQLTGHKSANVLLTIYSKVTSVDARKAISSLPPLLSGERVQPASLSEPTGLANAEPLSDNQQDAGPSAGDDHPIIRQVIKRPLLGNE